MSLAIKARVRSQSHTFQLARGRTVKRFSSAAVSPCARDEGCRCVSLRFDGCCSREDGQVHSQFSINIFPMSMTCMYDYQL